MSTQSRGNQGKISAYGPTSDRNPAVKQPTVPASLTGPAPAPMGTDSTAEAGPAPAPADEGDLLGQVVADRYRVLKKMGEGGMGTVYLAEHITIEKKVALKVLLHEYARKADLKERFLQEARAAARIGHENIVDITDFGDSPDGSVFFAMEFLEGSDLSRVIRKGGPIPWGRAKPILLQICRALSAAHAKGIIHRDMKPENIYLIEREGRSDFVKVLDFGIAKMSMEGSGESRLTRTGMIFGTPEYMSPEQAQGNKPDHRVDIYAVGVIMYEMLTGHVPFKADTFMGILTKHIFEQPIPPTQMNPDVGIPAEVEALVMKALNKERDQRFQSMAEMAAAIAQASGRMTRPTGDIAAIEPRIMATASGANPPIERPLARPVGTAGDLGEAAIYGSGRRSLIIVGVVVGLLIAGGVGAFLVLRGDGNAGPKTPPPKEGSAKVVTPLAPDAAPRVVTPPPKVPLRHLVTIRSKPADAEVFAADGSKLGKTPLELTLDHGTKPVVFTLRLAGYQDRKAEVTPDRDKIEEDVGLVPVAGVKTKRKDPKPKLDPKPEPKPEPKKVEPRPKPEPKKVEPKPKPEPKKDSELKNPFGD
jgi:serine/threonine-protein kinase